MRRRRLRWDSADGSIPVRGKRGWVDHLVTVAGVPITIEELDAALRGSYQDYESYVLQQLGIDEDEEGERNYGYRLVPGVANRIPGILIPRGWELDLARQNVSDGICRLVAKIVATSTRSAYPKASLRRLPWMVRLCEHVAFGEMRWEEGSISPDEEDARRGTDRGTRKSNAHRRHAQIGKLFHIGGCSGRSSVPIPLRRRRSTAKRRKPNSI